MIAIDEKDTQNESDYIGRPRPVVLLLLDGWGVAPVGEGNAISLANTDTISSLVKEYPVAILESGGGSWNSRYLCLGTGQIGLDEEQTSIVTLSSILSQAGLSQLKITDADRFAALTYFFNGLNEGKKLGEDWQIISTTSSREDKITADFKMVLKSAVKVIQADNAPDFITISLSYLDLVATVAAGKLEVVIKAVEAIDKGVRQIINAAVGQGGVVIISSAGGNAEQLINIRTEEADANLTSNPVPVILVGEDYKGLAISGQDVLGQDLSILQPSGTLADIAPTILTLFGLEIPAGMSGRNLLT